MTQVEKIESLREPITKLYSIEGRTKSYISRLFDVDRKTLSNIINYVWKLEQAQKHYFKPSVQKFLNKHKELILSRLNHDVPKNEIAKELGCERNFLYNLMKYDKDLKVASDKFQERIHERHNEKVSQKFANIKFNFSFENLEGEEWKPILGFSGYMVSNKGRVKRYLARYENFILLNLSNNIVNNRLYVSMQSDSGKTKNLQVSRLVGFTFLGDSYSEDKNTINHKDGNVQNNCVENLEWISQSENNKHSYDFLNRKKVKKNKLDFKKVIYKETYEFKTVAALSRFIGKSETQTRRYLEEPEKHDLKIIL